MEYRDLREWIDRVDDLGELQRLEGADCDLEIGALTEIVGREFDGRWALLFDNIRANQPGYRILTNFFGTIPRMALTVGFPLDIDKLGFVERWRQFLRSGVESHPKPPVEVAHGPVLENVRQGNAIDLLQFPVPLWHELDGGRYIGAGCCIFTRDPESGWINIGTYRVQLIGPDEVALFIAPGQQGYVHMMKYWERGQPCPVAMTFGQDPLLYMLSTLKVPAGVSEYEYGGALRGRPYEVVRGPHTGLPIPADAEIAIEADVVAGDEVLEGPFGEYTGYYAGGAEMAPRLRVKSLFYRDAPILAGASPARPPWDSTLYTMTMRSGLLWNQIEAAGVPDVRGVWIQYPGSNFFVVVSIKQRYAGHAKQAAAIASHVPLTGMGGKWVVVVDDDIDPTNINDVLWAMSTRCDPERDIEFFPDTWSHRLDPMARDQLSSKVIVDACKPYHRLTTFPKTAEVSRELREKTLAKWGAVLGGEVSPMKAQTRR